MSRRYLGGMISSNFNPFSYGAVRSGVFSLGQYTRAVSNGYWMPPNVVSYETLTFVYGGNLTVTNNGTSSVNIFKTSGSNSWDNQAYCSTPFSAPITIEFNKLAGSSDNGASYSMISLNSDPTTDASYSSLDYAAYPFMTSAYYYYHNGSGSGALSAWDSSKKFYIVYATNGYIYHYNGSTLLASFNKGTGGTVYIDSSFYAVNSTYGGFSAIRAIKKTWNGTTYE